MRIEKLGAAGLLLFLGSCSNAYQDARYSCAGFTPSTATVTTTIGAGCTNCAVNNVAAVIDDNIDTFADVSLVTAANGQGITIRATSKNADAFPIGDITGALLGISNAAQAQLTVNLNTYLAGTLQESSPMTKPSGLMNTDPATAANAYYGFTTAKKFDAVEFQITNGTNMTAQDVHVHGLCSTGGALY